MGYSRHSALPEAPLHASDPSATLYPIRVVIRRTGLTADLLRAWERRHRAITPVRTAGGQRLYSDADIDRLILLHRVTELGHAISQVAQHTTEELRGLLTEEMSLAPVDLPSEAAQLAGNVRAQALELIERFDDQELDHLLRRAALHFGVANAIELVLAPLMREVGERWHQQVITPAHEHLATAVVERVLHWMLGAQIHPPTAPRLVVATTAGERHELGVQITAAVASSEGWRVIYLGADLPADAIIAAVRDAGARLLALSLVSDGGSRNALSEVRRIRAALPPAVTIIIGGVGAEALADQLRGPGIRVLADQTALRVVLRSYRDPRSP